MGIEGAVVGLLIGVSDAVQGPFDAGEGHRFKCASGAIPGAVQGPFKVHLNHHSSVVLEP